MVNRRNFLKAITAFVGAAAIPTALVEACQIDAPIPKDWIVGLLDNFGNVFAQTKVAALDQVIEFGAVTRSGTVTHIFIEGGDLPGVVVSPLTMSTATVCCGDSIFISHISLKQE
jgi:hypothetical protein